MVRLHIWSSSVRAPRLLPFLAGAVLLVAACSSTAASPTAVASAAAGGAGAAGVVVTTTTSASFGAILTGPNGMTLYTHAGDTATESTCTGACATAWPPLATTGMPTAGAGVTGTLGTTSRADGTTQVTYDGHPLYYWQGDTKAGDVTGDDVEGFSVATVGAAGTQPPASEAAPTPSSGGTSSY
jgi:predicted lipoprotein with Yx(FWY)xxD motif